MPDQGGCAIQTVQTERHAEGNPGVTSHVAVVVNRAAGSGEAIAPEILEERLKSALGDNSSVELRAVQSEEIESALKWAFTCGASSVIIVGGDGTARAAARLAIETGIPMAPLPGGTMNVLPKLVFGHANLSRAIDELPMLQEGRMDVGRAGNEPFFLTFAAGIAGSIAKFRESLRRPRDWSVVTSSAGDCTRALGAAVRGRIDWNADGRAMRPAQSLVVALGGFNRVLSPETPNEDRATPLQAAGLRLRSHWDIMRVGAKAVTGNWRESKYIQMADASVIEVDLRNKRPLIVLDGEPMRLSRVDNVYVDRGALPVLAMPGMTGAGL